MVISYVILLILVFFVGFQVGKSFILRGLSLRVEQLHQELDGQKAFIIEEILNREEQLK